MRSKLSAGETLECLIEVISQNVTELYGTLPASSNAHFIHGEKTAYVECLEIVQYWEKAAECGLSGRIEEKYPV